MDGRQSAGEIATAVHTVAAFQRYDADRFAAAVGAIYDELYAQATRTEPWRPLLHVPTAMMR